MNFRDYFVLSRLGGEIRTALLPWGLPSLVMGWCALETHNNPTLACVGEERFMREVLGGT